MPHSVNISSIKLVTYWTFKTLDIQNVKLVTYWIFETCFEYPRPNFMEAHIFNLHKRVNILSYFYIAYLKNTVILDALEC